MENVHIKLTGRVQMVGFRYSAMRMASRFNIRGFIKNMSDGSVQMEAEGEPGDVDVFVQWCRKGPPGSRVELLDCTKGVVKGYLSFEVRY